MSDFFQRLSGSAIGQVPSVTPPPLSRFAPPAGMAMAADPFSLISTHHPEAPSPLDQSGATQSPNPVPETPGADEVRFPEHQAAPSQMPIAPQPFDPIVAEQAVPEPVNATPSIQPIPDKPAIKKPPFPPPVESGNLIAKPAIRFEPESPESVPPPVQNIIHSDGDAPFADPPPTPISNLGQSSGESLSAVIGSEPVTRPKTGDSTTTDLVDDLFNQTPMPALVPETNREGKSAPTLAPRPNPNPKQGAPGEPIPHSQRESPTKRIPLSSSDPSVPPDFKSPPQQMMPPRVADLLAPPTLSTTSDNPTGLPIGPTSSSPDQQVIPTSPALTSPVKTAVDPFTSPVADKSAFQESDPKAAIPVDGQVNAGSTKQFSPEKQVSSSPAPTYFAKQASDPFANPSSSKRSAEPFAPPSTANRSSNSYTKPSLVSQTTQDPFSLASEDALTAPPPGEPQPHPPSPDIRRDLVRTPAKKTTRPKIPAQVEAAWGSIPEPDRKASQVRLKQLPEHSANQTSQPPKPPPFADPPAVAGNHQESIGLAGNQVAANSEGIKLPTGQTVHIDKVEFQIIKEAPALPQPVPLPPAPSPPKSRPSLSEYLAKRHGRRS